MAGRCIRTHRADSVVDRGSGGKVRSLYKRRPAASLIEMLAAIFVIIILLAILIPGMEQAREQSRRVICKGNLRQWGAALQFYRDENDDYIPTEGTYLDSDQGYSSKKGIYDPRTWFNTLPKYLSTEAYRDTEGVNVAIRERPDVNVWICPSTNRMGAYKSLTGKNQFHYGMNQVLDGMGSVEDPSPDTPDFPDQGGIQIRASRFLKHPTTVFLFDIAGNMMAGSPRNVATMYTVNLDGDKIGKYHGDFANVLHVSGSVIDCRAADLVENKDFKKGKIVWEHPSLYWGYKPKQKFVE